MLAETAKRIGLPHVLSKPWEREAWERAKPWVMEQRQKLEDRHWMQVGHLRTELFALRKPAPPSADTEDGYIYIHMPRKFIDFVRSGKTEAEREAELMAKGHTHHHVAHKKHHPSYDMTSASVWPVRVEQSEEHDATVLLDTDEALENMFYLLQCISPGMARLHAERHNVVQPGTRHVDDHAALHAGDAPSVRIRAMVADDEEYVRILPPAYWIKRHAAQLTKILGTEEYAATLTAACNDARANERHIVNLHDAAWEEALPPHPSKDKKHRKHHIKPEADKSMSESAQPPPLTSA